jgi:hypothetical protein
MEKSLTNSNKGWKNSLKIFVPYFFVVGVCQLIGCYFAGVNIKNYKTIEWTTKLQFTILLFSLMGTLLTVWLSRKYVDRKSFKSLGFSKGFIRKDIFTGIVFGFVIMFLGFVCLVLTKQIFIQRIQFLPSEILLSFGLFIFVAIAEELLLRGYILNNLMTSFNKNTALVISSIVFSLLHAANPGFNLIGMFGLFIAGLFFGLGYIYTKGLWFPIALHFSWNFFQGTIFGFNVSGKDTYSLIITKNNAFNIWNGGSFGFEASLLSILFQIIAISILVIIFKPRLRSNQFPNVADKTAANQISSRPYIF